MSLWPNPLANLGTYETDALGRPIGHLHPHSGKGGAQATLASPPPSDAGPSGIGQHPVSRQGVGLRHGALASKRSISAKAISGLVRNVRAASGTPALSSQSGSDVQISGRNRRKVTGIGTSLCASVRETGVWQLSVPCLCQSGARSGRAPGLNLVFIKTARGFSKPNLLPILASLPPGAALSTMSSWLFSGKLLALSPPPNGIAHAFLFVEHHLVLTNEIIP